MSQLHMGLFGIVMFGLVFCSQLQAQGAYNPYHEIERWDKLPGGEVFGPLTGGFPDPDGRHMWLLGRCGDNNCADSDRDPILKFDLEGNFLYSWGAPGIQAGGLACSHGITTDQDGNLFVADCFAGRVQKFVPIPGVDMSKVVGQILREYPID